MKLKKRPTGACVVLHGGRVLALRGRPRMLLPPVAETFFAGTVFANARRARYAVRITRHTLAAIATSLHRDNPQLRGQLDLASGFKIVPLLPAGEDISRSVPQTHRAGEARCGPAGPQREPKRRRGPKTPPPNLELFAEVPA